MPFPDERVVATADDAVAAAAELGFPVVVKLGGDAIAHKTERGLVRLGLGDADAVRDAAAELLGGGHARGRRGRACSSRRWCAATASSSPGWHATRSSGMTVMLGVGGVLAEAVADVALPARAARPRSTPRR